MNINGIGIPSAVSSVDSTAARTTNHACEGQESTPASVTQLSSMSTLLYKLGQLAQQDPAQFKQVTQDISDQLKQAAGDAQGQKAQFLNNLSDKFAQASSSGDVAALEPQGGGQHVSGHHHHHHHGGEHSAGSSGLASVIASAIERVDQALSQSGSASAGAGTTSSDATDAGGTTEASDVLTLDGVPEP